MFILLQSFAPRPIDSSWNETSLENIIHRTRQVSSLVFDHPCIPMACSVVHAGCILQAEVDIRDMVAFLRPTKGVRQGVFPLHYGFSS